MRSSLMLAAVLLACWMPSVQLVARPYQSLVDNSPFLTPAFKARLGRRDSIAMDFVGYTRIGDVWHFALTDKKGGRTRWLKMNEEKNGILVDAFDEKKQQIGLLVGDIRLELTLEKGK